MGSNQNQNQEWLGVVQGRSGQVSLPFSERLNYSAQAIDPATAQGYTLSSDINNPVYAASILQELRRPRGDITTLLDLTPRDVQDGDLFPLATTTTWFTRDQERKLLPFVPHIQESLFRGPAAFGQRFSFDVSPLLTGDYLFGAVLQIRLGSWLPQGIQNLLLAGHIAYADPSASWEYANSLGTAIVAQAELEIDGDTIEQVDGDFTNVVSNLFQDLNGQFGVAYDSYGRISTQRLLTLQQPRLFPTEGGTLNCLLPFFFSRAKYREALPMASIRDGLVRIHITLRPFEDCVRQLRGFRDSCTATPLGTTATFVSLVTGTPAPDPVEILAGAPPAFESVKLITYGGIMTGPVRTKLVRAPHEIMHRAVQTFFFDEPLKYVIGKRGEDETIRVQLPLEANHPLEEILWFVRRKGVKGNNEWTNYGAVLEADAGSKAPPQPLLRAAAVQANGTTLCEAEEGYFRNLIAQHHKGGVVGYRNLIYGYPFARTPGRGPPSGTMNASRLNSLRLTLDVRPPGGVLDGAWEVKVFCIGFNWLRFEHGIANPIFDS
jgi:hypothetical protein